MKTTFIVELEESKVDPSDDPADIDQIVKHNGFEEDQAKDTGDRSHAQEIFHPNRQSSAHKSQSVFRY